MPRTIIRPWLLAPVLIFGLFPAATYTDEDLLRDGHDRDRSYNAETLDAIEKGLAYLAKTQNDQGAWDNVIGYKLNYDYMKTGEGSHVGVTALAGMAFLANGHAPGRGKYGRVVQKALDFVLACVDPESGYIRYKSTRMYSHAFAALFLGEIYGMSHRADLKDKLKSVVDLLVHGQNKQGGWRYNPFAVEADISITVCQLQFLRAARNCGIAVPQSTIERAVQYVKACRVESGRGWGGHVGAFRYQASRPDARYTFALTAAGLTALNAAGVYNDPMIRKGIEYLMRERGRRSRRGSQDFHYFYGHYYAIQALYQAGGHYWNTWWPQIQQEFLKAQHPKGNWHDEVGDNYATAMATLILSVPLEYLPIFQR